MPCNARYCVNGSTHWWFYCGSAEFTWQSVRCRVTGKPQGGNGILCLHEPRIHPCASPLVAFRWVTGVTSATTIRAAIRERIEHRLLGGRPVRRVPGPFAILRESPM